MQTSPAYLRNGDGNGEHTEDAVRVSIANEQEASTNAAR
jgi:hypothetical protein